MRFRPHPGYAECDGQHFPKELKDAGFPLKEVKPFDARYAFTGMFAMEPEPLGLSDEECLENIRSKTWYAYPTLSELIEACGEYFRDLQLINGQWKARAVEETEDSVRIRVSIYPTPEEAVAKLWLVLKKNH